MTNNYPPLSILKIQIFKYFMFVSEKTIDSIVENLENSDFEQEIEKMGTEQPALMSYVFSEDFELLTQGEREIMLYCLLVIWQSVEKSKNTKIYPLSKKTIETAEEHNWELLDNVKALKFRDRITIFFENSDQEDLLAFIEDILTEDSEDNENHITKEGREPMFVALKSVVDALCN